MVIKNEVCPEGVTRNKISNNLMDESIVIDTKSGNININKALGSDMLSPVYDNLDYSEASNDNNKNKVILIYSFMESIVINYVKCCRNLLNPSKIFKNNLKNIDRIPKIYNELVGDESNQLIKQINHNLVNSTYLLPMILDASMVIKQNDDLKNAILSGNFSLSINIYLNSRLHYTDESSMFLRKYLESLNIISDQDKLLVQLSDESEDILEVWEKFNELCSLIILVAENCIFELMMLKENFEIVEILKDIEKEIETYKGEMSYKVQNSIEGDDINKSICETAEYIINDDFNSLITLDVEKIFDYIHFGYLDEGYEADDLVYIGEFLKRK